MAYSLPKDYKPQTMTGFKGVTKRKVLGANLNKPYMAYISIGKSQKTIGHYATPEEAALAYNEIAKLLKGNNTFLNNTLAPITLIR